MKQKLRDYDFSMIVEQATSEQMDRINDAFVEAVEKENLVCGGGCKPIEEYRTTTEEEKHQSLKMKMIYGFVDSIVAKGTTGLLSDDLTAISFNRRDT